MGDLVKTCARGNRCKAESDGRTEARGSVCVTLLKACAAGADRGGFWKKAACKQNQEGCEESATRKGDRVEGLEGKFNVLSFKMSPPCNFSLRPVSFNFPDPLEMSPARSAH